VQEGQLSNGSVWQSLDMVACVEGNECLGFGVVLFRIEDGMLKFTGIQEFLSESAMLEYLKIEGYHPTNKRIEMVATDAHKAIQAEKGDNMPKVEPGQVWQNGRVVVSVQKLADALNLIQFEIKGKGLKFTSANMFDDHEKAARYITGLKCSLTDKVLVAADESYSAV